VSELISNHKNQLHLRPINNIWSTNLLLIRTFAPARKSLNIMKLPSLGIDACEGYTDAKINSAFRSAYIHQQPDSIRAATGGRFPFIVEVNNAPETFFDTAVCHHAASVWFNN